MDVERVTAGASARSNDGGAWLDLGPGGVSSEKLAQASEPRIVVEPPGPHARDLIARDVDVTSPSLPRAYPFVASRGGGSMIQDVDGNVFLDFNAGIAVCSTGHAHPAVVDAIGCQAGQLLHYSASDFYLPVYAELCERLDRVAPMSGPTRTFLTNSGTEAVEAAIKMARQHTGRQYLLAFVGSFHGRSYGSVSLTASKAKYHEGFGPMLPGVVHVPHYGDPASLSYLREVVFKRLVSPSEIAALFVEPVLGEGGYHVPPRDWLRSLRDLCSEHGILFVADEVQSGMGRTGRMWAVEHFGIEPDILLSGKGIASGMPLGAAIARADVMSWDMGAHGSTYGGNPVCCAAALATLDLLEGGLVENAARVGGELVRGLRELHTRQASVTDVRGLGLMIGVDLESPEVADAVEVACFQQGLLVLRAGDATIRIAPPLVLTSEQAANGLRIFERACSDVAARGVGPYLATVGEHEAGPGVSEGT